MEININDDDAVKKMTAQELEAFRQERAAQQQCLQLTLMSKAERFHTLALMVKGHGLDYKTHQKESYELYQEMKELKQEIQAVMVEYVLLKRRWETLKGTNSVREVTVLKNGSVKVL